MSIMDGLTDFVTGGENKKASEDLASALAQIEAVQTPTAQDLQLGPLAQYANAGDLTAALAQAAQAGPSAYDSEVLSSVPMSTMQQALSQEAAIANAQGMTPQEQAAIAEAEQDVNRNLAGQRGAIAQSFAGMGVPASLVAAALEQGALDNTAQQEYQSALTARANAANQGITALQNEGALAGQMYGQQATQANTIAAAQDALQKFNVQNTQDTALANQANRQAANVYNTQNKQNLANQNTTNANQRTIYNQTQAPVTAADLALQKASDAARVYGAQAIQATKVGEQNAGLFSGILGEVATVGNNGGGSAYQLGQMNVPGYAPGVSFGGGPSANFADGGEIQPRPELPPTAFARGGYLDFREGGPVPGQARVPGDSEQNDVIPARLSPGEVVIPRSVVANPKSLPGFLAAKAPTMARNMAHPGDVASVLRALAVLREQTA